MGSELSVGNQQVRGGSETAGKWLVNVYVGDRRLFLLVFLVALGQLLQLFQNIE